MVALKELMGEGCPWVGAVVRRLAQLHHIKGDAIMAEGLYGGAAGRLDALGTVDIPTSLRAEHVLLLVSELLSPVGVRRLAQWQQQLQHVAAGEVVRRSFVVAQASAVLS